MPDKPIIHLAGNDPFDWEVSVNWHVEGKEIKFNLTVRVATWTALSSDFEYAELAKLEGCAMMAAMTAELQEAVNV